MCVGNQFVMAAQVFQEFILPCSTRQTDCLNVMYISMNAQFMTDLSGSDPCALNFRQTLLVSRKWFFNKVNTVGSIPELTRCSFHFWNCTFSTFSGFREPNKTYKEYIFILVACQSVSKSASVFFASAWNWGRNDQFIAAIFWGLLLYEIK